MNELLIRALQRTRLLNAFNLVLTLRAGGRRIRVPFVRGVALAGIEEPWMFGLVTYFLGRTSGAFVDVGVNLGQTLVQVKRVDPARRYVGFEPNPTCVAYVHELIRLNRFESCTIIPAALHREDRVLHLDMYHPYLADGTASVVDGFRTQRPVVNRICVAAYRFATVAASLPSFSIGVIKIDVEGAELDVLQGLQEAVQQHRPVLFIEVLPVYKAENEDRLRRQEALEKLLSDWGYVLLRVRKDGRRFAGLDEVGPIGIHGDLGQCDYVAVPRETRNDVHAEDIPR